ncbi:hypothetical protein [Halalkalibacter krulwichiae]|uniref:Uncharacterized protein n=1 Tax=Halalkalibacter krulwichiae TaxID=199441 RepID=A0A1X9MDX5_9BACI|nr:hypothetical protein [Halalkalibacter krulwichiae]ARK30750.1 hypothetical protein BkAM31D_13415 [Halalkalibacter krulwichiae]
MQKTNYKIEGINTLEDLRNFPDSIEGAVEVEEGLFILKLTMKKDEILEEYDCVGCEYVPYKEVMGDIDYLEEYISA